jgi:serine/threonine-protein kinase
MGLILEGTHLELGTPVAIKVLHERLAQDPERVERFLREAKAAAQLRGEHVCRVHDCGTLPGGEPFMVMELLAGCDLSALVDQLGPLAPETVIAYAKQACAGVAEAHAIGLVHRDLKPTNIFRTTRPDGAPLIKILDFGLAKPMNGQDLSLTATATVMGSPRYMSPEQLKSSKVTDPRSDIWALGIVMFELLSGKPPFDGDSITELALNITNDPVPPLPDSVPPALAAVVMRCLQKDAMKRYQSAVELAAALDAASTGRGATEVADTAPDLKQALSLTDALNSADIGVSGEASRPSVRPISAGSQSAALPQRRSLRILAIVGLLAIGPAAYAAWRFMGARSAPASAASEPRAAAPADAAAVTLPVAADASAAAEVAASPADAGVVEVDAAVVETVKEEAPANKKKRRRTTKKTEQTEEPPTWKDSRY